MSKIFHTYIKKYQFLTSERFYDEFVSDFKTTFTENDSTIYFITKCKKPCWVQNSIKFLRGYKFSAKIEVDNIIYDVEIDMADYWYNMSPMKKVFPDKYVMANEFMARSNSLIWRYLPKDLYYKFLSSVDSIKGDGKQLIISCGIKKFMDSEAKSLTDIFLYQAINHYNLPEPKIDIIYIGSSLKNTFSRLQKHEKWGWILSQKTPNEDILVYLCEIEGDKFTVDRQLISKKNHELNRKDETLITEMALINYFKPYKYNEKHVKRPIKNSNRVKKQLINRGYTQVCVEMILEGNIAKLGSKYIPRYGKHIIHHDIT